MNSQLASDAIEIASQWEHDVRLADLVHGALGRTEMLHRDVDVVSIGKAATEMASAVLATPGMQVARALIVSDSAVRSGELPAGAHIDTLVGDHPIPGLASLHAGQRLTEFLAEPTQSDLTLFLVSGGASSLCVVPEPPLGVDDLKAVWDAALATGADITGLNRLRAASSRIGGGAVLRQVRTKRSQSLIMVDNVLAGPGWVASALTYDYRPGSDEVVALLRQFGLEGRDLAGRILEAFEHRQRTMSLPGPERHRNEVLVEPSLLAAHAAYDAARLGYRTVDMGSRVHGDVVEVTRQWSEVMGRELERGDRFCLVGVGEVTVKVRGGGRGGRCQEFAWSMAESLAPLFRDAMFVARSSDGRDFIEGVAGAWADNSTTARARLAGFDWADVIGRHDSFSALSALRQLLLGAHTGWNLCDVYVLCVE